MGLRPSEKRCDQADLAIRPKPGEKGGSRPSPVRDQRTEEAEPATEGPSADLTLGLSNGENKGDFPHPPGPDSHRETLK